MARPARNWPPASAAWITAPNAARWTAARRADDDDADPVAAIDGAALVRDGLLALTRKPDALRAGAPYARGVYPDGALPFQCDHSWPAFVADDGRIVNLADMKPQTTDSHCSTEPVRYVLEMNQGWFSKRGVKAGSRLGGFPARP